MKKTLIEAVAEKLTAAKMGRRILRFLYFIKHKQKLQEFRIMSVLQYCEENRIDIHYIENENKREVTVCPALNGIPCLEPKKDIIPVYPVYTAELKNAVVTGYNDGIILDHVILNDRKDYIAQNTFAPRPYYCLSADQARNHMLAKKITTHRVIEKGLCIAGRFPDNWWHYTYELLARIALFNMDSRYDDWPLVIDDAAVNDKSNLKLLKCLNIKKHPLVTVKRNESIFVRNLAYAANNMIEIFGDYGDKYLGYISPHQIYIFANRLSVTYIRNCVLKSVSTNPNRKIFIARARKGRLVNENETALFFRDIGFEILYSDKLSFEEEVEAFSNAGILISTMGGAMTNLVYASPNAKIVCIFPHKAISTMSMYQSLAQIIGFQFYNWDAKIVKDPKTCDAMEYVLPKEDCIQMCKNMGLIGKDAI